jgi:hypothetical protein
MRRLAQGWLWVPALTVFCSVPALGQGWGSHRLITQKARLANQSRAVDLDNDGDPDVLSVSVMDGKITWHENVMSDGFGERLHYLSGFGHQHKLTSGPTARSIYATDLDGDGDLDVLAAVEQLNQIAWFENLGSQGTVFQGFGPMQKITSKAQGAWFVFSADLDGDGDPDVLSASRADNKIAWYENRLNAASADFGTQQVLTSSLMWAYCVHAADLDGDGDVDVLGSGNGKTIFWFENLGSFAGFFLGFGPPQVVTNKVSNCLSMDTADLDGDGDLDLISGSCYDDKVAWYENRGTVGGVFQGFGGQKVISTAVDCATNVHAADLDGDGDLDVISASTFDGKVAWYENLGGSFGQQQVITNSAPGARSAHATDLDGDGDLDVLVASAYNDTVEWYENKMGTSSQCNIVFCDTDPNNVGSVTLGSCDCSGGTITLQLSASFPGQFTYPLVGLGTTAVNPTGVSELCLAGSTIGRYTSDAGAISASGTFSVDLLNAASAPGGGVPTIGGALCNGNTWRFQYWHRDGMNPSRFSKGIAGLIN